MSWLHVPMALMREYVRNLPRLLGEESLNGSAVVAVGSGWLKPDEASKIQSSWRRASRGPIARRPDRRRADTPAELRRWADEMGIELTLEKRPGA